MPADFVVKTIPESRLVARTATLDPDRLGEHIGPMFDAVAAALRHAPGTLDSPIATYSESEAGMDVVVGYANDGPPPDGTTIIDLPRVEALCGVRLGPMSEIHVTWQELRGKRVWRKAREGAPCALLGRMVKY